MRFIIHIMRGASLEATATLTSRGGETPEEVSKRARALLIASAMDIQAARGRQTMTEDMLERLADLFAGMVLTQAQTGAARYVTVHTRGDEIHQHDGEITLLGSADDITGLIDIEDAETLRRNDIGNAAPGDVCDRGAGR